MAGPGVFPMPIYVAPHPGGPLPTPIPTHPATNPKAGYWAYSGGPVTMQAPGVDGAYGWPIYIQGGTSSNPQFAYYPVAPGTVPPGVIPTGVSGKHHRGRQAKDSDDDDEGCPCHECTHGKRSAPPQPLVAPAGVPMPHPHPGHFIAPQFFMPPATTTQQSTTTFIPYVIPSCSAHHCKSKSTTESSSDPSTTRKHHTKKSSTSSYHYADGCDCPTCKARRMAIEMERIQEERQREREYKDAQDFLKMKDRVEREEREAAVEEAYRAKKTCKKHVSFEEPLVSHSKHPDPESEYEWVPVQTAVPFPVATPAPFPVATPAPAGITAFHPGGSTPITLQPIHPGPGPWMGGLEEENAKLRHQKEHLKRKVQRERSLRNKDDAARAFLSTRLNDLDQDVQELKKKVRHPHGGAGVRAPYVEIEVPIPSGKHHHSHRKSTVKDKGKEGRNAGDHVTFKGKNSDGKHKHPHICYDSDCDNFDSCSECSFECDVQGCRTCRPHGGRR
ncbi:hypothetical protein TWF281_011283 [Arthrobotrys megalospora]